MGQLEHNNYTNFKHTTKVLGRESLPKDNKNFEKKATNKSKKKKCKNKCLIVGGLWHNKDWISKGNNVWLEEYSKMKLKKIRNRKEIVKKKCTKGISNGIKAKVYWNNIGTKSKQKLTKYIFNLIKRPKCDQRYVQ